MNEDKEKDAKPAPEEHNAEVVQSPGNRVEVSADLLNEAVSQLRKMAEIRLRDSERQERAISQMQTQIKRGRILSRYVIFCCLVVMVISAGLAYLMWQSATSEKTTAKELVVVNERLNSATQTIAEETQKQITSLDNIRQEQSRFANDLEKELKETRQIQAAVVEKVDEQLGAVRGERDQITGEVRSLLEEKTAFYIAKEQELEAEREAIADAKERSKEEQKELINDTIARLNAMAASLDSGAVITVEEVDEAVNAAEEAMVEADRPAVAETADDGAAVEDTAEEIVTEDAPAAPAEDAPETEEPGDGAVTIEWSPEDAAAVTE